MEIEIVTAGAAVGIIAIGILAIFGGIHDHQVVTSQLKPQKIFFPAAGSPDSYPDLDKYAGKQVTNGNLANIFANKQIARDLLKIAGGKTYSEVSAEARVHPTPKLLQQESTLFQGTTLRGMLLNAWGWGTLGTIAIIIGLVAIVAGIILLALPLIALRVGRQINGPDSQ